MKITTAELLLKYLAGEGVDSVAMFDPITKYSTMMISKYKVPETIREALRIAFSGKKGPVHLSYPKDLMDAEIEDVLLPYGRYRVESNYFDRKLVIDATEKLVIAKKPAMIVGSGVVASDATMEVLELAEMLNIPVATTPKAKGAFPEDHPLSLGILGFSGSPTAEEYLLGDIDVLFAVGTSLNQMTTFSWDPKLEPSDALIHINIDPSEIGKNYAADIGLVGDCRAVLDEISFRVLRELQKHDPKDERPIEDIITFKKSVGLFIDEEKMFSESVPIKPQALMRELQESLPETEFNEVNCAKVAEGLGAQGYRIQRPGELSEILPEAIERAVPTVIDVIIDPNEVPPVDRFVKGLGELSARLDYL